MFDVEIYRARRDHLREGMDSGLVLFPGHEESPMNYRDNPYHFRQESSFLYFFGLDGPGLAGLIDLDENREILFGDDASLDDIVWSGPQTPLSERAQEVGIAGTEPRGKLSEHLAGAREKGRRIHFLPPSRPAVELRLERLLALDSERVSEHASAELTKRVAALRSVKAAEEIAEIEGALEITYEMHTEAMRRGRPGVGEQEIAGLVEGIALSRGGALAFPVIFSVRGEVLHNHHYGNTLEKGDLALHDSGAESAAHYAADITRTFPVGGGFDSRQKEIYELVLGAQEAAIEAVAPSVPFRDIHLLACRRLTAGLKDLGLMRGEVEEAVSAGAHALFLPHGLGHMMGLDVHDMEGLGEDIVGYDESEKRSSQFGLGYLRLARKLEAGFVVTVEPGLYFIPALIDRWRAENTSSDFIDYDKVEDYRDFGGVRIEDDVLVLEKGHRVLGKPIPKEVEEVEDWASR